MHFGNVLLCITGARCRRTPPLLEIMTSVMQRNVKISIQILFIYVYVITMRKLLLLLTHCIYYTHTFFVIPISYNIWLCAPIQFDIDHTRNALPIFFSSSVFFALQLLLSLSTCESQLHAVDACVVAGNKTRTHTLSLTTIWQTIEWVWFFSTLLSSFSAPSSPATIYYILYTTYLAYTE